MAEQGPLSGFRDMLAETMIPRERMIETIRRVYEDFGFSPLKTPTLERLETLSGKYGEEGEKLMYRFKDNGGRWVAMRYDHSVPLARVIEQYGSSLTNPWYKRFAMGDVWRGDRPQAGRYREFAQFDADIVGTSSAMADAEIVEMTATAMQQLGALTIIRVNNRLILDGLVQKAKIKTGLPARRFIGAIDKLEKIGLNAVLKDIKEANGSEAADLAEEYLSMGSDSLERLDRMQDFFEGIEIAQEGIEDLRQVFAILKASGFSDDQVIFDPTIARGLDYYTGIIFETNLKNLPDLGSVCSGGRYDQLVKSLGGPDTPAVGTSIGVDRLFEGLRQLGLLHEAKTTTRVLIVNFGMSLATRYAQVAKQLRDEDIPTEIYYDEAKIGKQLTFASKKGIPFAVIIGKSEQDRSVAKVRDMDKGTETEVPIASLIGYMKNNVLEI